MKKFTGQRLRNLAVNTGLVKLGLVVLIGLAPGVGRTQTNFASAQVLTGDWGSVSYNNGSARRDSGFPGVAGFSPNAPIWFQWTAPSDGEVELDTINSKGSIFGTPNVPLDTVLGVYTGTNVTKLNQVAANDDIYPYQQENYIGVNIYETNYPNIYSTSTNSPFIAAYLAAYYQPYGGPSGLRFNATAGTTYYFVVDTKAASVLYASSSTNAWCTYMTYFYYYGYIPSPSTGLVSLNWAFHSSGVFRFATESVDQTAIQTANGMPMLLYQCAETESETPVGEYRNVDAQTLVHTYYTYNNPGVLVTVTRVAGSSGRVSVGYTTVDGYNGSNPGNGDNPAVGYVDYWPVSGTLIFDDFEMSKTILIPIIDDGGVAQPNRDFTVVLQNPQRDANETSDVSLPRLDTNFDQVLVRILDVDIDPKGESQIINVVSNGVDQNGNPLYTTNITFTPIPTNVVLNFQKAHYRVAREVTNWWGATPVTVYVNRTGTNISAAATANWRINNYFLELQPGYDQQNIFFPLEPGSDYAMPDPPNTNALVIGMEPPDSPEFTNSYGVFGTLNWAANDPQPKAIHFTVYDNGLTDFNKDLTLQLYIPDTVNPNVADQLGMVAETTVTIMFDDQHPPAGSVDELYNADFNLDLKLPASVIPATSPQNNPHPGADGEVYGLAILPNNETVIVGDFFSYDGFGRNCIALVNTNGMLDGSFSPSSGANNFINAVALASGKFVIGGGFTSFNGASRNGIARVNANGTLDTTFLSGLSGADGTVWAVAVQPNGQVLIGGDFTHVNSTARNHIARLNTDGSLDATFNPGTNFDNSVYALALDPAGSGQIFVGGGFDVRGQGYGNIALLNSDGSLNTSFNPGTGPDNWVYALCWQPNGQVLLGGNFTHINGSSLNSIARLNADGSIDTAGFFPGTGADDTVYCITYSTNVLTNVSVTNNNNTLVTNTISGTNNNIYVGGSFMSYNGTRRLGFTRLNTDGTVDTAFLDTAYNQFAGLSRIYYNDTPGSVYACGVQSDGNVMIAGSFDEVGGGQADKNIRNTDCTERGITGSFADSDLWISDGQSNIEPKTRDGVRNRSNVARLIGGSINGAESLVTLVNAYAPGNIGMVYDSYSADESQYSLNVTLARANGGLGPAGANFAIQPGLAVSGVDYVYNASDPLYWIAWENTDLWTRMHRHGFFGTNGIVEDIYGRFFWGGGIPNLTTVQVTVHTDPTVRGNLSAQFQLANPASADQFYLGGQNIPLGVALGSSVAPFTLIDDNTQAGKFGFAASSFITASTNATISVLRSNGTYGTVSMKYSTGNGTAVANVDYIPISPPVSMNFNNGVLSNGFKVTVLNNGVSYTNPVEKTVNLLLSSLNGPVGGNATYGISNAVLRLINPNYQGYLTFSATNYTGNESAGFITFVVNRTSGSYSNLSVQYATTNGTAINGVDYIGSTNTLSWSSGDVSPRTVNIPLINTYTVGGNKQFAVSLSNPALNGASDPSLFFGAISNATLTINNNNSYGTLQFSAPSYLVNENGGYATITVIRTGGAGGSVSVNFATSSQGATATSPQNYVTNSGTLTFAPDQIASSFTVQMVDDGVQDPTNFFFYVSLSSPTNATLSSPSNAVVNILDYERYPTRTPGSPGTGTNSISGANGGVLALALQSNGQILVGGNFTQINSVPENYVARLNANGSLDTTFLSGLSGADGPVYVLASQTNSRILMGGAFTSVNGVFLNHIARLMTDGTSDTSFNPGAGADGAVNALAETFISGTREIYVGGAFTNINSVASPGIARLNDNGTVDGSFVTGSGADGAVYAVAVYPTNSIYAGKVLIGGAFTHYNGTNLNYIARLNADGSVDTTFNPGSAANSAVNAIAIQLDGRVLVGGSFFQFNGVPLNRIARLNADGSLDTGFTAATGAGVNNTVEGIALQTDNRIVLVGQFTQVEGLTCNRIVRLLPTGAVDTSINFGDGANSDVDAVVIQPWDGMIILGGAFTQFNDQPYDYLVRLYGGSAGGSIPPGGGLVVPAGSALVHEGFLPPNGIIDPGETNTLLFAFRDISGYNVTNLVATLLTNNNVTFPSGPQTNSGVLIVGGPSVSLPFTFTASGTNGQSIAATFQLQSGTNNLGTAVFNYVLGILTNTFANTNLIVINDYAVASPYPSIINASGVGGSLFKATVTFANLTHSWPADIDALLESPYQQSALLMANAGGGYAVNGVTLTFDDAALTCLTNAGQIVSGTYKPTAYFPVATFPAPAPAAPYATNLSIFNSSNPNGSWSLFVIDDTPLNAGAISNGWSLNLITASPVGSAADVGLAMTASPNPVGISNNLTCVIAVTNYGPSTSTGVTVTNTLPSSGAQFVSATGPGSWSTNGSLLVWNVGTLAYGAGATLTLTLYPTAIGSVTDSAIVSSVTSDPNPNDNAASVTVTVGSVQPPQFGTITTSNGTFQLTITSPTSSTIIQATTNLLPSNWLNIYTGTPPFTFTDPNASNYPYRFYRAKLGQ